MTVAQAATLKKIAQAAYELDAFKPNLTCPEADKRIAMLTAKLKLLDGGIPSETEARLKHKYASHGLSEIRSSVLIRQLQEQRRSCASASRADQVGDFIRWCFADPSVAARSGESSPVWRQNYMSSPHVLGLFKVVIS
jgi:hypothetical protein